MSAGGRPRKISSPEEFDKKVDDYVQDCQVAEKPLTLTGLILALGLSSRQSLDEYLAYEGFPDSVKRAKLLIENQYEQGLHSCASTGSIFALKNFGWRDKTETEHSGSIRLSDMTEEELDRRIAALSGE